MSRCLVSPLRLPEMKFLSQSQTQKSGLTITLQHIIIKVFRPHPCIIYSWLLAVGEEKSFVLENSYMTTNNDYDTKNVTPSYFWKNITVWGPAVLSKEIVEGFLLKVKS